MNASPKFDKLKLTVHRVRESFREFLIQLLGSHPVGQSTFVWVISFRYDIMLVLCTNVSPGFNASDVSGVSVNQPAGRTRKFYENCPQIQMSPDWLEFYQFSYLGSG